MVNELLVNLVNGVLGTGKRTARGNQAYTCPFCHHHKPKLEVNFTENKDGVNKWACWACGKKGKTIRRLMMYVYYDESKDRSEDLDWKKYCDEQVPTEQEQIFWGNVSIIFVLVLGLIAVFL